MLITAPPLNAADSDMLLAGLVHKDAGVAVTLLITGKEPTPMVVLAVPVQPLLSVTVTLYLNCEPLPAPEIEATGLDILVELKLVVPGLVTMELDQA